MKWIVIGFAVIAISVEAQAQPAQQLGIPAFYDTVSDSNDWSRIETAGNAVKIVVADLTTLSSVSDARSWFGRLHGQGQKVLGYVDTQHAGRSQTYVLHGHDPVPPSNPTSVDDWYNRFGGYIDGIFLDNGPSLFQGPYMNDESYQESYYGYTASGLYQAINGSYSGSCGPYQNRACVMMNGSQFPHPWVMSVADFNIEWERELHNSDGQDYLTNFIPNPTWWSDPSVTPRAEHVVYQASSASINDIVCTSWSRGTPMLYIHDEPGASYSRLPSFFEQEVAAVQGCPNPDTIACGQIPLDACGNPCPVGQMCGDPLQR